MDYNKLIEIVKVAYHKQECKDCIFSESCSNKCVLKEISDTLLRLGNNNTILIKQNACLTTENAQLRGQVEALHTDTINNIVKELQDKYGNSN